MTEEFDKEIDVLLRQAARRGETVSEITVAHLDADEINTFAEHALPEKGRVRAVEHLANCARCRSVLSNLIDFNAQPASEIIPEIKTKNAVIPWYKRLFVFPQIAYAMGLTVLIFAGIFAILTLKNSAGNNSSEVARVDEKSPSVNPVSVPENANSASSNFTNSTANFALAASNDKAANSPHSLNRNNSPAISANPNAAAAQDKNSETAKPAPKPSAPPVESEQAKKEKTETVVAGALSPKDNNYTVDGAANDSVSANRQAESSQNSVSQNQSATPAKAAPEARAAQSLPLNGRSEQSLRMRILKNKAETNAASGEKDEDKPAEIRSVGGKSFRRADGVWYDEKYKGQKTINIKRDSSEYQKLDGGLRAVADNLSGVIIIVWKDTAYRIW
ncbi:MAG: hypothetical protein ACR2GD_12830 [Pyrinomonadaceae bacterium]